MIEKNFDIPFIADLALREKQIQQNYRPIIAVHKWFAQGGKGQNMKTLEEIRRVIRAHEDELRRRYKARVVGHFRFLYSRGATRGQRPGSAGGI